MSKNSVPAESPEPRVDVINKLNRNQRTIIVGFLAS